MSMLKYEDTFNLIDEGNSTPKDIPLSHIKLLYYPFSSGKQCIFPTKQARDAWFEAQKGYEYDTKFILREKTKLKVELEFEECRQYNYAVIEYKDEYYFYWIDDESRPESYNSTIISITRDPIQQYIYDATIRNVILVRGHKACVDDGPDAYLANPSAHVANLLVPEDYTPDLNNYKKSTQFSADSNTNRYIVFTTTANLRNVSEEITTINNPNIDGQSSGVNVYAVKREQLNTFIDNIRANAPWLLQTFKEPGIQFSEDMISLSSGSTVFGVTLYDADSAIVEYVYNLSKSDFGYISKIANFTKAYTFPYCILEVSDNKGNIQQVQTQDISGKMNVAFRSAMLDDNKLEAFLTNVGGNGYNEITVQRLDSITARIYNSAVDHYRWLIDTPSYSINESARKRFDWDQKYPRDTQRYNIDQTKINADANVLTSYNNTKDSLQSSYDISQQSKIYSRKRYRTNFLMQKADMELQKWIDVNRSQQTWNVSERIQGLDISTAYSMGAISAGQTLASSTLGSIGSSVSGDMLGVATSSINTVINCIGSAAQLQININKNLKSFYEQAKLNNINTMLSSETNNIRLRNLELYQNEKTNGNGYDQEWGNWILTQPFRRQGTLLTYACKYDEVGEKLGFVKPIDEIKWEIDTGFDINTVGDWDGIQKIQYDELDYNSNKSKDTGDTNNSRSRDRGYASNTISKNISDRGYNNDPLDANMNNVNSYGSQSGRTMELTHGTRGICVRLITMNECDQNVLGDIWTKFGYRYNQILPTIDNFQVMNYFTYWEIADMDITIEGNYRAAEDIKRIFANGITIYDNPDNITQDIYNNLRGGN